MDKTNIVIYHGNCADGFGAAWSFWKKYQDRYDYYPGVYSEPPPCVTNKNVYLVDFSYKRAVVEQIIKEAHSVTIIDHHKTALEDLKGLDGLIGLEEYCSLDHSGAVLAWKYCFFGEEPPRLLKIVEDRDLWRFKLEDTRLIQAAIFSYPYDFHVWDELSVNVDRLAQEGIAIERKHHRDIDELLSVCKRDMVIGGYTVPVAGIPYIFVSDAGTKMAANQLFAACYWDTATHRIFGLRSRKEGVDVSEIAKQYGGGGHEHAAGFAVPRDHILARS